jgi:hypothetical protein
MTTVLIRGAAVAGALCLLARGVQAQPRPVAGPVAATTGSPKAAWRPWIEDVTPASTPAKNPKPTRLRGPAVAAPAPTSAPKGVAAPTGGASPAAKAPAPERAPVSPAEVAPSMAGVAAAAPAPPLAAPPIVHVYLVVANPGGPSLSPLPAVQGLAGPGATGPLSIMVAGPVPPGAFSAPAPVSVSRPAVPISDAAAAPTKPAPPLYSLPWQLRPALLGNVARLDTVLATDRDDAGKPGITQVTTLLLSRKLTPRLMPLVRLGAARAVPASGAGASVFLNPVAGLVYGLSPGPGWHLAGLLALSAPFGTGGGNDASDARKATLKTGGNARSAMDGAMFSHNDLGLLAGADLAYLWGKSTVQVEATLIQLARVRGAQAQKDAHKTNFTSGLHAGHFLLPQLSIGGELRYQRWLSSPAAVVADASGASRDTMTVAAGIRVHARVGPTWVRPGVSLTHAMDKPLSARRQTTVQIDLPVAF